MKNIISTLIFCLIFGCSSDTPQNKNDDTQSYAYTLTEEKSISSAQAGSNELLVPTALTIANDKLYVCTENKLEIYNAKTYEHLKTIAEFNEFNDVKVFKRLTSVTVEKGKIYLGTVDSRVYILDEVTYNAINTIGNGSWSATFVHVFGSIARDGLLFVKEKENVISVTDISKVTKYSHWDIEPMAILETQMGREDNYSMDVDDGNFVVAGRNAFTFFYYNINDIKANATASLKTPIQPKVKVIDKNSPIAISFSKDWAVSSELFQKKNYIRIYPKAQFMEMNYTPTIEITDINGKNPFNNVVSIAQLDDHIFLADNGNKMIRVLKINKTPK